MTHTVSIETCADYEFKAVRAAVFAACDAANFPGMDGKTILLKPNVLNASDPARCATTHPSVLRAAIHYVREKGASRIMVGDSPGWQAQDLAGNKTGLIEVCRDEGVHWADFSKDSPVDLPAGSLVRRFQLAAVSREADLIISLPKLKTHGLMYFTGAVKNLFGLIPGLQKSAFHMRFPGRDDFATMLNDLRLASGCDYAIMDAVVGMQGQGPNSGTPCQVGLIMAADNLYAMDWVASDLIGYRPLDIPYLRLASLDPRYGFDPQAISLRGVDPESYRPEHFELIKVLKENDIIRAHVPAWLHRILKDLMVPRPVFIEKTCIHCAGCVKICPAQALAFEAGKRSPAIDYQKCIRCYCCDEVCPVKAIELKKFLLGRARR